MIHYLFINDNKKISELKYASILSLVLHFVFIFSLHFLKILDNYHKKETYYDVSLVTIKTNSSGLYKKNNVSTAGVSDSVSPKQRFTNLIEKSKAFRNKFTSSSQLSHLSEESKKLIYESEITSAKFIEKNISFEISENLKASGLTDVELRAALQVIANSQPAFRDCYEKELLNNSSINGKANILLNLSETGVASDAFVKLLFKKQANNKNDFLLLQSCLKQVVNKIHFPKPFFGKKVQFDVFLKL